MYKNISLANTHSSVDCTTYCTLKIEALSFSLPMFLSLPGRGI